MHEQMRAEFQKLLEAGEAAARTERIEDGDLAQLRIVRLQAESAAKDLHIVTLELALKYGLGPADVIRVADGVIERQKPTAPSHEEMTNGAPASA